MIDLSKYIYELLHSHECVVVPGLGGFIIRKKNAVIYVAQNLFVPPSKHLHFNAQLTHNDGLLAHYISKQTATSYEKAMEVINEAVNDILYRLYKNETFILNNIGTISNLNGFLKFEPASSEQNIQDESYGLNSFIMPMLQSERERKRPTIAHKQRKKPQIKPIRSYQMAAVIAFLLLSIGAYFLQTDHVQNYVKSSFYPQISFVLKEFLVKESGETGFVDDGEEGTEVTEGTESTGVTGEETSIVARVTEVEEDREIVAIIEEEAASVITDNLMQTPVFGQYYIIIGAFKHPELAENLCRKMKTNGYHTAAILDIPSSALQRVALQSFDNLASAQASLREVKQTMQEDAWVLKWKN